MYAKIDDEDYFLANLKGQIWLTGATSKPLMLDQIDLLQAIADTGSITAGIDWSASTTYPRSLSLSEVPAVVKVAAPLSRIMVRKC